MKKQEVKANQKTADKITTMNSGNNTSGFLFGKRNYMVLLAGLALMAVGYLIMTGGAQPPDEFDTKEIYGFVRISVSSILVTAGLIVALLSIFVKHKTAE